jgi:hypothetical protein
MVSVWLKGLIAALIGGAANGLAVRFVDAEHFNVDDGIGALLKITAVGAVVSVLAYLKQSPIPGADPRLPLREEQPIPKPAGAPTPSVGS